MTLNFSLFFLLVLCFLLNGVVSFECEGQVRNCGSKNTKCIYEGYKLTHEENYRIRNVTTTIPGPTSSIPLLFDNNLGTTHHTGVKPVQGKPVITILDLKRDYYLRVVRVSVYSRPEVANKTFTFRIILGQRDQNPCTSAEFTGAGVEDLVVVMRKPTKARYVRIENIDNPGPTSYNELTVIGTTQFPSPDDEEPFIRYNHSVKDELGLHPQNVGGFPVEGKNVAIAFRHIWIQTPDNDAIVVYDGLFPAAYRTDSIPNKCLVGYGLALRETSRSNRYFSFNWVNGLKILRLSLRLLNLGLNNTDGASRVQASLIGYRQGVEIFRGRRDAVHTYNRTRPNANPCTVPAHHLYIDTPGGADRVDLVLSHWKGDKYFPTSTEPVVIADLTYDLMMPEGLPPIFVSGQAPAPAQECINNQLLALKSVQGTEIRLKNVTISVSRSFSQDSLIVVQQGYNPTAYTVRNITNNCLGGAGIGLRRESKEARLFDFDFGNRILKSFSLVLVIGDENPFAEPEVTAQLVGWTGDQQTAISKPVTINLEEIKAKRLAACEQGGRFRMELEDSAGFSRVEFLAQAKGTRGFGSRLPLALSDICFVVDRTQAPTQRSTVLPQRLPRHKPFQPFGQCLSYELGEHSFDPTGLKIEGNSALPFRHLYINTSIGTGTLVQAGKLPSAYRVKGIPNDCLSGFGVAPLQTSRAVINEGITIQFISGYLVKHFGLNLINFGNENVDRAQIVRVKMVGSRGGDIKYETPARTIDYTLNRAGEWNPCTIPEGHSFYMDPGPHSFDRVDIRFEHSVDGKTFRTGTSESVVITDLCYDLFQPFDLPPSSKEIITTPAPLGIPVQPAPIGGSCLGTELIERRTNPVGQPVSGPRAYAFFHLWITPLLRNKFAEFEAKYPIAVSRAKTPALYSLQGIPNECMVGVLGVGFLPDKHLEIEGFDFRVVNGRAFSILSFQLISFERLNYRLRVLATHNGQNVTEKVYEVKGITSLKSPQICHDATTWVAIQDMTGFDAVKAIFEPLTPLDHPFSVNRVHLSSLCYTVIRG